MLGTSNSKLNQLIWRIFTKGYGLTLQGDAADFLLERLAGQDTDQIKETIDYIASVYSKQAGKRAAWPLWSGW